MTVAAALDTFGPAHTFETQLLADGLDANGQIGGGILGGPLYIKGGGNAFLLYENFLDWANQLRLQGVKKIDGPIVVDNTLFAGEDLPPLFDTKNEDAAYRAPIGALSVNFNGISVLVDPGAKIGEPAKYRLVPANQHIQVVNRANTVAGQRRTIEVASETIAPGAGSEIGTRIVISGSIGLDARTFQSRRKRIDNPAQFAGAVFIEALKSVGIEVGATVKTGKTPASARVLVSHASQPLSYIALATNKWSNNFMSEMLFRLLGTTENRPGTWAASEQAVLAFLQKSGIDTAGLVFKNGSGLYDGNRASPRQYVALLRHMSTHPWAPEFRRPCRSRASTAPLSAAWKTPGCAEKFAPKPAPSTNPPRSPAICEAPPIAKSPSRSSSTTRPRLPGDIARFKTDWPQISRRSTTKKRLYPFNIFKQTEARLNS